jgi:hypothetical protein
VVEVQDAAVVAALEDDDLLTSGRGACERERHHVRLGAGVAEADELDRREAAADRPCKLRLVCVRPAERRPVRERRADRRLDGGVRMPVEAGGVLAEEVEVLVAVGVPDASAFAADDRERERRHMEDAPRVAAGHEAGPLLVQPARLGVPLDVPLQRSVHIYTVTRLPITPLIGGR